VCLREFLGVIRRLAGETGQTSPVVGVSVVALTRRGSCISLIARSLRRELGHRGLRVAAGRVG
jgi:hypothetical protein